MKTIWLNVGQCKNDREDLIVGKQYNPEKTHNCLDCGYMSSYSREFIEIDKNMIVKNSSI